MSKSTTVGLLLVVFVCCFTSCRHLSLTEADRDQSDTALNNQIKLLVEDDGIYAVSLRDLVQSGLAIKELNPADLNLGQGGSPVPYLIHEERLIFYGQAPQSRYTKVRSYILKLGQAGTPMHLAEVPDLSTPRVDHIPQILHLEENRVYHPEALNAAGDDVWFWTELSQGDTFNTAFDIPFLHESPAHIRVSSWGYTDLSEIQGDHSFDLQLNDRSMGSVIWDGQNFNTTEIELPAGLLNTGQNKITLDNRPEGASFLDIMQINWLEILYHAPAKSIDDQLAFSEVEGLVQITGFSDKPFVFNISDPANPELLTGWEYGTDQMLLPVTADMAISAAGPAGLQTPTIKTMRESDWRDTSRQADLLIVTTDELAPALAPLVQAREDQGLSVAVVPVEDIYNEFGFGDPSAEGIRQFVAYAYTQWQEPRPKYLFLVGDATTDFLGYQSEVPANLVPTLLVPVQFGGETVSDARLADIDGDQQPDLAIGRWPVQTKQEVEDLVRRTLSYEQGTAGEKAIFIADESEKRFSSVAERLAEKSQIPDNQAQQLEKRKRADLAKQLNVGTWLATYVGHGSIKRWGKDDIFNLDAVNELRSTTPPIILQLTCLTGLFAHPEETSLVEAMLTQSGGPVISVAATSLTLSSYQETFAIQLLQRMQDSNIVRIGDAFQAAKLSLEIESSNGLREVSDTFTLFGDPTTRIVRP